MPFLSSLPFTLPSTLQEPESQLQAAAVFLLGSSQISVNAREFIQLAATWKDEEGDLHDTKNGELTSFLEQSISPLGESN